MNKYILIIALTATFAVTACGTGSTTKQTTDSTTTKVDSTIKVDTAAGN